MKMAGCLTEMFKKGNWSEHDNYRSGSILLNLSKVLESFMYGEISLFFYDIRSKYQFSFRKGHRSQHCLLALLETWKSSVDQGKDFSALLTDLSKTFDCLPLVLFFNNKSLALLSFRSETMD